MTLPQLTNRPRRAFFLISGNSCRRHRPGQSGTSSTSPSPFSSPGTSSSSCEPNPLLNFDREPSPPTNHFVTGASLRRGARRRRFSSTPVDPTTTGKTALVSRIHPHPRGPARSSQMPATIAGAPLRSGRGGRRRAATGQTGPVGPWTHCQRPRTVHTGDFGEREENFQKFGEHPAFPHIEGKHSESRHNILV